MRRILVLIAVAAVVAAITITACRRNDTITAVVPASIANSNFPTGIANIFINKCATAGCHDAASGANAGGLVMDTWAHLFNGAGDGAVVVPYSTEFSPLLYFINVNAALGDTAQPTMPISTSTFPQHPLSEAEYDTIQNWIAHGAPDKSGNIAFSTSPTSRQKIYLTQSGCNQMAVIDATTHLVMRYIPVGDADNAAQHDVTCSTDGKYAYVTFYVGNYLQKIDCTTDTVVATLDLGTAILPGQTAGWSIALLSPDNSTLMVSSFCDPGYVIAINTAGSMSINNSLSWGYGEGGVSGALIRPHGLAANASFDTFYTTIEYGNNVVKWWFAGGHPYFKTIRLKQSLDSTSASVQGVTPDPHQIIMSPDYSKYYVSCENTNEVRVLSTATDQVIDSIPVGAWPQEMAIDTIHHYLFAVCMLDRTNFAVAGFEGSVAVIDYTTDRLVSTIYGNFFEPHDAAVDELNGYVYFCSTNLDTVAGAPPPHHTTACGIPGWYSVYNLSNLSTPAVYSYFVLTDPYAITNRF